MADFVNPQFNNPDYLKSYVQGRQAGQEPAFAAQQFQEGQQGLQEGSLKLDQLRQALQITGQRNDMLKGLMSQIQQEGTQDASNQGGGTGGSQPGPQGSASQSYGSNYGYSPENLSQHTLQAVGELAPEMLKGRQEGDAAALKAAQMRSQMQGSPLLALESFANNANAGDALLKNPAQIGNWAMLAPKYGMDPKDMSNLNVRRVATLEANAQRRSLGMDPLPANASDPANMSATESANLDLSKKRLGLEAANEPMEKVIGPDGQPTLVPRAKAAGMTPFNEQQAAAGGITDQTKEFAYQHFVATGESPTAGRGGAATQIAYANYFAKRAAEDGNTAAGIAAKQQQYKATQGVLKDFESGPTGKTLDSINTAVAHLDALKPLIAAMKNGDVKIINQAKQAYEKATGQTAPTNYETLKNIAVGEVSKASLAGGGDASERDAILKPFAGANAPDVLGGATDQAMTALAGKTEAIRNRWNVSTNGQQGDFDKFLVPATKKALGIKDSAPGGGAAPVKVNSPAEAMKLPPGTVFITPDGRTKVR